MYTQTQRLATRGRVAVAIVMLLILAAGLFASVRHAAAAPAAQGSAGVGLYFWNELESDLVCYLYVKPSSQYVWGPDRLGDRVLLPGEAIEIPLLAGRYDVRVEGCEGNVLGQTSNMEFVTMVPMSIHWTGLGVG